MLSHHVTDYLTQRDDLTLEQVFDGLYIAEEVWVNDTQTFFITETLCLLTGFMEKHDSERLSQIKELNNLFSYSEEDEDDFLD